jgi:hypothetical protein
MSAEPYTDDDREPPEGPLCYGCGCPVEDAPGVYYCEPCVAGQLAANEEERQAFEAFHAYADLVAQVTR